MSKRMDSAMLRFLFLLLFLALALPNTSSASERKLKVVASIAPLADFVRQVGGNKVDVTLLLPPGASPHTYEPTPGIIKKISHADIFVKIGFGLEFWVDRLIQASGTNAAIVDCSRDIDLISIDSHASTRDHRDPHIWLDPIISIEIIRVIERALSESDPAGAALYRKNASTYRNRLRALDGEIAQTVQSFRTREFVAFHPAWNYFSSRYGLRIVGVIEEGPGKEPSPKQLKRIFEELERMEVKIIFAESQFNPQAAQAIAEEVGGHVLFLDPIGGQEKRETYIDMIRYNLNVMRQVMQ